MEKDFRIIVRKTDNLGNSWETSRKEAERVGDRIQKKWKRRSNRWLLPSEEYLYPHWLPILSNNTVSYY